MNEFAASPAAPSSWGVAALLLAASDALASRFGAVAVHGELGNFTRAASGHCYFSLKDAEGAPALLKCAMFRRAASLLDFAPAEGQQVEIRGRLSVYEPRGELQMVVESMRRAGAGTLYEEFLRRKARLEALGLFDAARKRPVSREPRALGIVTSLSAAALRDVATTLARRAPHVRVVVYPSPVQGADAPAALVAAIEAAGRRAEVDTLLLVRGGGSIEDLWAFNDERLVRAIAASPIPVISGVGHETDVTLADLAADLRAATPTAAAELSAPSRDEMLEGCRSAARRLVVAMGRTLQRQVQRLDRATIALGAPAAQVAAQRHRVRELGARLLRAHAQELRRRRERLEVAAPRLQRAARVALRDLHAALEGRQTRLHATDPRQVLQRGYAWVEDPEGRAIVSVQSLRTGEAVRAVWADGHALARVEDIERHDPASGAGAA